MARSSILNRIISNINREIGNSPLRAAGGGAMLLRAAEGDPDGAAFLAALAIKESSAGKHAFVPNNFWGWGIHAGSSVNRAPSVEAMARRVWKGLKYGPYYNTKGKRTSNQIMNVYAPPSENNTTQYMQQNNQRMGRMVPGYNPNTNLFAPGLGGPGGVNQMAGPSRQTASTGPGVGGGPGGAVGAAAGLAGSLQLDPRTAKMLRTYIVRENQALSKGKINTNMKLWNKVLTRLQQLPRTQVSPVAQAQSVGNQVAGAASAVQASMPIPPGAGAGGKAYPILPIKGAQWGSFGYGDPEGQGGRHMAVDWFAESGTPLRAPKGGKVARVTHSGLGPFSGQVFGGVISIRGNDGRLYTMRHVSPLKNLRVGSRIVPGQHIGTPVKWSGSDHAHFEIYRPGSSDREYSASMAINPRTFYGG